ncbi:hypothetical protein, partial [Ruminococcus sp.]|uniref:hypothetical protein n=1 Tax=Ruminococcus sp. TaxID=41978 RepID=UPI003991D2BB
MDFPQTFPYLQPATDRQGLSGRNGNSVRESLRLKMDRLLGADVQEDSDDGTGDGKRTAISNWNDLTGMGYTSTAG